MSPDQADYPDEPGETAEPAVSESVLITGFPAFIARRMTAKILASDPSASAFLLVRAEDQDEAHHFLAALPAGHGARVSIVIGDVCDMDLGLSGREFAQLAAEITTIQHMSGPYDMGMDKTRARRLNVDGTRGILELAGEAKRLRRLCHWSSASVAGKRKGVILEEELDEGQSFHNAYEETKFEAEKLAQAARRRMPVTIFRPGIIIGDSRNGEIDRFDGPYYLMVLIATNATQVHLPLPGRGTAPLHVAPVDFVIDAAYALALDERAAGRTFHLTDPNPFSARRTYQLVAERSHTKPPRGYIPGGLARTLLRAPGLERLARAPLTFLDSFDHQVFFNCRHTLELLAGAGISCPSFDTYVDSLVRYVREMHSASRRPRTDDGDEDAEPDDLD